MELRSEWQGRGSQPAWGRGESQAEVLTARCGRQSDVNRFWRLQAQASQYWGLDLTVLTSLPLPPPPT